VQAYQRTVAVDALIGSASLAATNMHRVCPALTHAVPWRGEQGNCEPGLAQRDLAGIT